MSFASQGAEPSFADAAVVDSSELTAMSPTLKTPAQPLAEVLRHLLDGVAHTLDVPVALLSRDQVGWRFEAEAFPRRASTEAPSFRANSAQVTVAAPGDEIVDGAGVPWTGLAAGKSKHREWLVMVPRNAAGWADVPGLETVIGTFGRSLETVVRLDDERRHAERYRRLYAFVRRLTRSADVTYTHKCVLQAMAHEVHASIASFALFNESEHSLSITST